MLGITCQTVLKREFQERIAGSSQIGDLCWHLNTQCVCITAALTFNGLNAFT